MKPVCPPIATYHSLNAPEARAWIAVYLVIKRDRVTGDPFERALPMIFSAASEDRVIAAAQRWWQDETGPERMRMLSEKRVKAKVKAAS
jgi:hypothetical protein